MKNTLKNSQEPQKNVDMAVETPVKASQSVENVESLIAQAEQRGYLRGRNERIEELMRAIEESNSFTIDNATTLDLDPAAGAIHNLDPTAGITLDSDSDMPPSAYPDLEFLASTRPSIWDR